MQIYKEYDVGDVLFDLPYEEEGKLRIYPIKVKDYKKFKQYLHYFLGSKKHYQLDKKTNLLDYLIAVNVAKKKEDVKGNEVDINELIVSVIHELEQAFSLICREEIYCNWDSLKEDNITFTNGTGDIQITKKNFDKIRRIILKQNVLIEPKIFEDEIEAKLAEKYMKAKRKKSEGKVLETLGEMANVISCYCGKSYEELYNQNLMQFHADYNRCLTNEEARNSAIFRTVSDKVKVVTYSQPIIKDLFKDPYAEMWKNGNDVLGI